MDQRRFDALARALGRPAGRRAAVAAMLAALAGGARGAAACTAEGRKCGTRKTKPCTKCCTYHSENKRCACKPNGMACGNDLECCGGWCSFDTGDGRCATGA